MPSPRPPEPDAVRERLQADHWNGLDAHDQLLELRRFVPAEALGTRVGCPMCGKGLDAQALCPFCGDEDVDADTGVILPDGGLNDGMAA